LIHLDGRARHGHFRLRQRGFWPCAQDHLAHEIEAADHLGDRVLDLDARVHLDEEKFAAVVVIEIFERAGAAVAGSLGKAHR
jgi:hypothetical protein